jgi:hypothetical protein
LRIVIASEMNGKIQAQCWIIDQSNELTVRCQALFS